jgi:hypothetical protein
VQAFGRIEHLLDERDDAVARLAAVQAAVAPVAKDKQVL